MGRRDPVGGEREYEDNGDDRIKAHYKYYIYIYNCERINEFIKSK